MAALAPELLLLRDSGRFLADNLLSSEDWGGRGCGRGLSSGGAGLGQGV